MYLNQNFNILFDNDINFIFDIFKKYESDVYIVGGAIRNAILNQKITDIDFSTPIHPSQIIKILDKENINFNDKFKMFGTIIATINKKNYEITSFRKEHYFRNRFPKITFINDIKQDAKRRDFTINSIYIDRNKNVFDFYNGIKDIETKTLKFIKNPIESINEDTLRILRYFRFIAEYSLYNFDKISLNTCITHFDKTFFLSKNRYKQEFTKIKNAPFYNIVLDKWQNFGILSKIESFLNHEKRK